MEICLEEVGYKSGKVFICQNINWQFSQGQHWVLFGENGSGKTTLLSLIAGYHSISRGTISLDGEAYSEQLLPKIKKNIALVSSSFFNNYLTGVLKKDLKKMSIRNNKNMSRIFTLMF